MAYSPQTARSLEYSQLGYKAKQYEDQVRASLQSQLGGARMNDLGYSQTAPNRQSSLGKLGLSDPYAGNPNYVGLQHGVGGPTQQQLGEFIQGQGGNPYLQQLQELQGKYGQQDKYAKGKSAARTKAEASAKKMMKERERQEKKDRGERSKAYEAFQADVQAQAEEAKAVNLARYEDILGDLQGRYDRNMERVDNWGISAVDDTSERFREALGSQQAELSSRGFGSSTMGAANIGRNARDKDRALQKISEQRDARAAQYDMQLSSDVARFKERREDIAPDFGQMSELAAKYGLSNAGRGYNAEQQQPQLSEEQLIDEMMTRAGYGPKPEQKEQQRYQPQQPQYRGGFGGGGVSPYAAAQMQQNLNQQLGGLNPFGTFGRALPQPFAGGSNAYPANRHAVPQVVQDASHLARFKNKNIAPLPLGGGGIF